MRQARFGHPLLGLLTILALGCGGEAAPDAGPPDAGAQDAGAPPCEGGFLASWAEAPAMPAAFESHASVAHDGRVYVIGGWNEAGGARTEVYVYDGAWRATSSLPAPLQHHSAAVHAGHVFVFGGDDGFGGQVSSTIYHAPIEADGGLGAWTVAASMEPRSLHAAASLGDRVYLIGGIASFGAGTPEVIDSIVSARIDEAGAIGAIEPAGALPAPLAWHAAAAIDGRVYVVGGLRSFATGQLSGAILAAEVAGDALGAFTEVSQTTPRMRLGALALDGALVIVGGLTAGGPATDVTSARPDAQGQLVDGDFHADLPEGRYGHGVVARNGEALVTGGFYAAMGFDTRDVAWTAPACPR